MVIQAILSNPAHPKYGVASISFPIPHDLYAYCLEQLEELKIGNVGKADCKVEEVDSAWPILKCLENQQIDVDELDYLAKRLDSFDVYEAVQFAAIAAARSYTNLADLINLTFCCQRVTVFTDFSNLDTVGRNHYMNLHGGCAKTEELDALDGEETARQLIEGGGGIITPYGVVYDNGMQLERFYDGQHFPCYFYEPNPLTISVTAKGEPEDTERVTWLYLPMAQEEIKRAMLRAGISHPSEFSLRFEDSQLPDEVDACLNLELETIADLNALAQAADSLSGADIEKLGAVVALARPKNAEQIRNLAESLILFDFAPDVHTPTEYGKYMIQKSGRFEYDQNLDDFYDYEKCGLQSMDEEDGLFTDRGYIAYRGCISMEEVMNGSHSSRVDFQMGGCTW